MLRSKIAAALLGLLATAVVGCGHYHDHHHDHRGYYDRGRYGGYHDHYRHAHDRHDHRWDRW